MPSSRRRRSFPFARTHFPQAQDGDEAFRKDRRAWYEHATGETLEGLSLAEQWRRVDVLGRSWRAYGDGQHGKQKVRPFKVHTCVECGCKPCECPPPGTEPDYDDYPADDY